MMYLLPDEHMIFFNLYHSFFVLYQVCILICQSQIIDPCISGRSTIKKHLRGFSFDSKISLIKIKYFIDYKNISPIYNKKNEWWMALLISTNLKAWVSKKNPLFDCLLVNSIPTSIWQPPTFR